MPVEEDDFDVGFTTYEHGCTSCGPKGWEDGKPIRHRIVPCGKWMRCENCGGSYGSAPTAGVATDGGSDARTA